MKELSYDGHTVNGSRIRKNTKPEKWKEVKHKAEICKCIEQDIKVKK